MWFRTRVTYLAKIKYPIIQGPFGGRYSSAKLVAAVSNSGGLGSFGLNSYSPEEIGEVSEAIKSLTNKPYVLNLWVPLKDHPAAKYTHAEFEALKDLFKPIFEELGASMPEKPDPQVHDFQLQVEAVIRSKPSVASFIFGIPPADIIHECKRSGIVTFATATTLEEALLIEEVGIDAVVASGAEAGGHRASFLSSAEESLTDTKTLIRQVSGRLKIPVIAAGGISDGRGIVEMLKLGASAVQMGTAFLATEEANTSQVHKDQLLNKEVRTSLTKLYSGRLARLITNPFIEQFKDKSQALAPYPIQSAFLNPLLKVAQESKKYEFAAFWSGQPSAILKHKSAEALFQALVEEAFNSSRLDKVKPV